jgi:hypothetical protein
MGCHDHRAASTHMLIHEVFNECDSLAIERGEWLIEDPEARIRRQKPRKRDTPALAGR